jgi:hypothetical protein
MVCVGIQAMHGVAEYGAVSRHLRLSMKDGGAVEYTFVLGGQKRQMRFLVNRVFSTP